MRSIPACKMMLVRLAALMVMLLGASEAQALPLYARQTGQECAACHNGFPELTPYGRLFKLNGYTFGGGQSDLPPVSAMVIGSYNSTQAPQPAGSTPAHTGQNDNFAFDSASLFTGGAITPNIGGFIQGTYYNNVARNFNWDNTDIRYANTTQLFGSETIFGVSLNNNPSVSDVWNSTPAWAYPFVSSSIAPTPGAKTAIEGSFAQQVVGATAYTFWNRLVYAELGPYSTLTKGTDSALGVNPNGTTSIKGLAPYWRLAVEPKWGADSLEIGTFGFAASLNPGRVTGSGNDHDVDIGFDTQYQYLGEVHSVSLQASYITENQSLTASQALGNSTNSRDHLRSMRLKTSYYYDQTYGVTASYFQVRGTSDSTLYSSSPNNSPNSAGWIGELDYIPFNHGGPSFWPWLNVKFGLQYVYYDKFNGGQTNFDGSGRNAHDNNTIYAFTWIAF